jgi:hypothetical protein
MQKTTAYPCMNLASRDYGVRYSLRRLDRSSLDWVRRLSNNKNAGGVAASSQGLSKVTATRCISSLHCEETPDPRKSVTYFL